MVHFEYTLKQLISIKWALLAQKPVNEELYQQINEAILKKQSQMNERPMMVIDTPDVKKQLPPLWTIYLLAIVLFLVGGGVSIAMFYLIIK